MACTPFSPEWCHVLLTGGELPEVLGHAPCRKARPHTVKSRAEASQILGVLLQQLPQPWAAASDLSSSPAGFVFVE